MRAGGQVEDAAPVGRPRSARDDACGAEGEIERTCRLVDAGLAGVRTVVAIVLRLCRGTSSMVSYLLIGVR